jgi:hypothetical protein
MSAGQGEQSMSAEILHCDAQNSKEDRGGRKRYEEATHAELARAFDGTHAGQAQRRNKQREQRGAPKQAIANQNGPHVDSERVVNPPGRKPENQQRKPADLPEYRSFADVFVVTKTQADPQAKAGNKMKQREEENSNEACDRRQYCRSINLLARSRHAGNLRGNARLPTR